MEKENGEKRYWRVDCWVYIPMEDPEVYDNLSDAQEDCIQCCEMGPDDHFVVVECKEDGKNLE